MASKRSLFVWWILALLLAAGFARLGVWQLDRAAQKRAVQAQVAQVLKERRVIPLATVPSSGLEWVEGTGHFVGVPVLLDNQQRNGQYGVQVYGALVISDSSQSVLVDLGWLRVTGDRVLPQVTLPAGDVLIRGLRAPPPSGGIMLGGLAGNMQSRNGQWLTLHVIPAQVSSTLHLSPPLQDHVVRLDPSLPIGYPRDLTVLNNTMPPERHLAYAVQWFGLALLVLATALILTLRKSKHDNV